MSVLDASRSTAKENPREVTILLSVVGYALVIGSFAGYIPFPSISKAWVDLLSHVIAVINTLALLSLLSGYYFIKKRRIKWHKRAMVTSFTLILIFLVVYLIKVGGGGTKLFQGPEFVKTYVYLPMLAVHLVLSVVSVPVVLYAVVLGLTHTPAELPRTSHPKVGKIAVYAWVVSLTLGLLTYFMLNIVYGWEYTTETLTMGLRLL
ncbi:MAG: DUF420 domain-containing protein [Halobacteria archaeon]|nr:DUF420 domain-containing protein [Halobacteria archaeon]